MSTIIYVIIAFLIILPIHEAAHAWSAYVMGDDTAKRQGRMTLNPLKHLDLFGTIMLILFRIGWGKPVPVNINNFKNPKVGYVISSLAGPLSNLILAAVLTIPYKYFLEDATGLYLTNIRELVTITIILSIFLMLFNLIPVGPLDGAKIWYLILPERKHHIIHKMEREGLFFLIVVFLFAQFFGINLLYYLEVLTQYIFLALYLMT